MDGGDGGAGQPGLVLRVVRRRAVVLSDGRFVRVAAAPGWEAGQEVLLPAAATSVPRLRWRLAAATLGAAAVLGGGLWAGLAAAQPVAVVSVDAGSAVQIGVNAAGRVVSVRATDPAGALLLAGGDLRGRPLAQAIATVVQRAAAAGYLSVPPPAASRTAGSPAASSTARGAGATGPTSSPPPSTAPTAPARSATAPGGPPPSRPASATVAPAPAVLFTLAPTRPGAAAVPAGVAAAVAVGEADAREAGHGELPVAVDQVAGGVAAAADAAGLSVAQYMVWQTAQAAGVHLPASAVRGRSLGAFLRQAGVPPGDEAAVEDAAIGGAPAVAQRVFAAAVHGARPATLRSLLGGAPPTPGGSGGVGKGHGRSGKEKRKPKGKSGKEKPKPNGKGGPARAQGGASGDLPSVLAPGQAASTAVAGLAGAVAARPEAAGSSHPDAPTPSTGSHGQGGGAPPGGKRGRGGGSPRAEGHGQRDGTRKTGRHAKGGDQPPARRTGGGGRSPGS